MEGAPALLIFKRHHSLVEDLTDEEAGKVWKALFRYILTKEEPTNFPRDLKRFFLILKEDVDINEEMYEKKRQRNKRDYEKRKEREKDKEKPPNEAEEEVNIKGRAKKPAEQSEQNDMAKQDDLTQEQQTFLNEFKKLCPNKKIDCDISNYKKIDFVKLIQAVKESPQFLMNAEKNKDFDLKWYLENADKIISGKYKKFAGAEESKSSRCRLGQTYTDEELDLLSKPKG